MYESAIDLSAIRALDMHVHVETSADGHHSLPPDIREATRAYFKSGDVPEMIDGIAEYYRERQLAAVVFTVDAETTLGHPPIPSEQVAAGAARNADVLIPFGSVDPLTGPLAIDRARSLALEHGVRGFKFHPSVQGFDPSDPAFEPLFEALEQLGLPVIFHTGQTGIGAGMPGGRGIRLALSNPMLLDGVAANFPNLPIVMAHPSFPWQEEALAVATHKHNVWIDLSGWAPKYFPEILVRYANTLLSDRVMFGSDYPLIMPERWFSDFEALKIRDEVRPKILKDNAARLLGLA